MSDPMFKATPPNPDGVDKSQGPAGYTKMFPQAVQDDPEWKPVFEKYQNIGDFLKAVKDPLTKPFVRTPDEKATPEEKEAFWQAAGKPKAADEYEVLDYADVPLTADQKKDFKQKCFKLGLTKDQAKQWYEDEIAKARDWGKSQTEAKTKAQAQRQSELFAKWGAEAPVKEDRFQKALPGLPEGLRKTLEAAGVLDHPEVKDYIQGLYKSPENRPETGKHDTASKGEGALFRYKEA